MDFQEAPADMPVDEPEEEVEDQAEVEGEAQNVGRNRFEKSRQLPREFHKAKRTLTRMINEYFNQLKTQLFAHPDAKFLYSSQYIECVQSSISKLATVRYIQLSSLTPKKSQIVQDFLLSYISQSKKIIKYNLNIQNSNNQKPKQIQLYSQEKLELPDSATPAAFGANAYFFDGAKFDFTRMVYVPMEVNYRVNLITGQVGVLEVQPKFYRMKCCIIKVKRGFFIMGGYAGPQKWLTKQCLFYSTNPQKFHELAPLNLLHNSPSGCAHNDKVFVFSKAGIEYYSQLDNAWVCVKMPRRLRCLPFQYCISVSEGLIMMIGGKMGNRNSEDIRLYDTEKGRVDLYAGVLPVGVSNERSWGPMLINNFITVMSNIQASTMPQVAVKRDAVQMVLIGFGGCFLNTLITA